MGEVGDACDEDDMWSDDGMVMERLKSDASNSGGLLNRFDVHVSKVQTGSEVSQSVSRYLSDDPAEATVSK